MRHRGAHREAADVQVEERRIVGAVARDEHLHGSFAELAAPHVDGSGHRRRAGDGVEPSPLHTRWGARPEHRRTGRRTAARMIGTGIWGLRRIGLRVLGTDAATQRVAASARSTASVRSTPP